MSVFWWFERGGRYLRCEAQQTDGGYELRILGPDGSEHVERFTDSRELSKRQNDVFDEIAKGGWTGPHGWNL
jgi:hypothetical protein